MFTGRPGTRAAAGGQTRPSLAGHGFGEHSEPRLRQRSRSLIEWLATRLCQLGIEPGVEAFDRSMIFLATALRERCLIERALHLQFLVCAGNVMTLACVVFEFYVFSTRRLAPDFARTRAAIGGHQMEWVRWSLDTGWQCHTGMDDNVPLAHPPWRRRTPPWPVRWSACSSHWLPSGHSGPGVRCWTFAPLAERASVSKRNSMYLGSSRVGPFPGWAPNLTAPTSALETAP